ncbi:zinc ribbon domain-containing protein [Candidatus Nomurabacteria bacterium]|nr:zinc ribbon domain-containing protein [Candidatus Nomurabacteria bacterium]MCB9818017.1 zinc ribbon domain-containing protein [Candidatus Nomurabacteria bacterium]
MFCTNCGNELNKNQNFCTNCGEKHDIETSTTSTETNERSEFCTNCGQKIDDGCQFCTECGTPANGENDAPSSAPSHTEYLARQEMNGFYKLWRLIYPKVKYDKAWHRVVMVVGWVVSIPTYFLLFPIYFGIIQRVIYFVAYGDNKDKWLIKE